MFQINCPWCGPRGEDEFSFGGEIDEHAPPWDAPLQGAQLADYLFMRKNTCGMQFERWLHTCCGQWLRLSRNTKDHTVLGAAYLREP
jgi:heterotetrameric sarcosine oxidase delta subunit